MTKNELIIQELSKCYDGEKGSLDFSTPFELLIAVMLSAQCTDARVNIVTKDLFKVCNTPEDFEWAEQNARRVGRYCRLYLQPEWSVYEDIMPLMVEYAKANPKWSVSIQTHKFMHIP